MLQLFIPFPIDMIPDLMYLELLDGLLMVKIPCWHDFGRVSLKERTRIERLWLIDIVYEISVMVSYILLGLK